MGKKNKKFKKFKKTSSETPVVIENLALREDASTSNDQKEPVSPERPTLEDEEIAVSEKYLYVRKDVKKLFIVLAILALLFTGFYFLSIETTIFEIIGNWVYKAGNFQIS